jgi:hypothetical protein
MWQKKDILGNTDAAQQLRRSTDAVMITADLQRRSSDAVTELVLRCSFTDPTGWDGVKKY